MHLKTLLKGCAIAMALLMWTFSPACADYGPLQTTNRFPLHLMFLKPRPVNADLPPEGEAEATFAVEYSNTYFQQENSRWDVLMDMEMLVVDLSVIYGVTSRLACKIDLPVVSMNEGFLDDILGDFHDLIGVGNYNREDRPSDTFGYRVTKDGELWVEGDNGASKLADATVSAQYALTRPRSSGNAASSLLLSVKVPIGDEELGFGSGAFDFGIYVPIQWSGKLWSFYLMPSMAIINDPKTGSADVKARNSYGLFGGVAYDYSERLTVVAQLNNYSSPIEKTGISDLDDGTAELDVGFHYRIESGWIVEFAFCEDLTMAAPDFNVRLGLRWTTKSW